MSGWRGASGASTDRPRTTWFLGLIAKRMVLLPGGTATVELSAQMVDYLGQFVSDQASVDRPRSPSHSVGATMSLVGVATTFARGGHVAYRHQAQIRLDPRLQRLGSELAGLLDVVVGVHVTNPNERAWRHLAVIDQLVDALVGQPPGAAPDLAPASDPPGPVGPE